MPCLCFKLSLWKTKTNQKKPGCDGVLLVQTGPLKCCFQQLSACPVLLFSVGSYHWTTSIVLVGLN